MIVIWIFHCRHYTLHAYIVLQFFTNSSRLSTLHFEISIINYQSRLIITRRNKVSPYRNPSHIITKWIVLPNKSEKAGRRESHSTTLNFEHWEIKFRRIPSHIIPKWIVLLNKSEKHVVWNCFFTCHQTIVSFILFWNLFPATL